MWPELRAAGFIFDRIRRVYQTTDWKKAAPFVEDAWDDETYDYLMGLIEEREAALDASYEMFSDAEIAVPEMYTKAGVRMDYLPYQKAGILYATERRDTLIADPPGLGKGSPLWVKVLTPNGWQQIGDLVVGDPIIGADGRAHTVTGVYDKGVLPTYRVEFNDGASVHVDGDHLWTVRRRKESNGYQPAWETLETRELIERAYPGGLHTNKIEIPLVKPVEYEPIELPLDPYVIGALLGDGGITQKAIYFTNIDQGVLYQMATRVPTGLCLRHSDRNAYRVVPEQPRTQGIPNPAIRALRSLGLMGRGSDDKFIPESYLRASPEERLLLLQGLMDTDGYCAKDGTTQFSSNSKALRDGVAELVQSLGGNARKSDKISASGKCHYIATLNAPVCPFLGAKHKVSRWTPRTKYPPKRLFKSITPASEEPVRCISVSAPDQLYVTEDYIVTHNTIQAIGLINHLELQTGVIVCPATLKLNWLKEMTKWLHDKSLTVGVAYGNEIPDTDFVIINYDILNRNKDTLWAEHWDILICDEAQYLSNGDSKRTQAIFGEYRWDFKKKAFARSKQRIEVTENGKKKAIYVPCLRAEYRLFLTGTPMMKRPKDMWTMIRECDPNGLGKNFYDFALTYCDGTEGSFGLVADGGSNLEELNDHLRKTFMIRRLKKHVLKDLPEKTREVIVFPPEGMKKIIKTERDKFTNALAMLDAANEGIAFTPQAVEEMDPAFILDTMTRFLPQGFDAPEIGDLDAGEVQPGFAAYSEARHDLALSKVPMAVEHIKRLVDAGEKVIVFAIHKDVVAAIHEAFPTAARIIGGLGAKKVEAEKLRFQGDNDNDILPDEDCRVIICNLKAGGVGHTLTEATVVVFVEMWSVPGDMEQCEDRAHRIGLKHNVLVQYLVVDGTIDAITIQELIDRIAMIEEGVDGTERVREAA